jgi:hypothetical protein
MKIKSYLLLLIGLFFVSGCGTVNVALKPQTTFSKNSTITVVAQGTDKIGVQGKLEHLLLERGFDVVSEAVAQEKVKLQSESNTGVAAKSSNMGSGFGAAIMEKSQSDQTLSKVTEMKSAYILRFQYHSYYDVFYWSFTSFNASVVDLVSGEVVASANFSGDRSVNSVLEEFANKLSSTVN